MSLTITNHEITLMSAVTYTDDNYQEEYPLIILNSIPSSLAVYLGLREVKQAIGGNHRPYYNSCLFFNSSCGGLSFTS